MKVISNDVEKELLRAMEEFKSIAQKLIERLVAETDQPEKVLVEAGEYSKIQNAELLNGQETLSENWGFDVHGEHCKFRNMKTGQTFEVTLGDKESIANLDPYFFYEFLETTATLKHLTQYFEHPFRDILIFFEKLTREQKMTRIDGVNFRKVSNC